MSSEASPLQRGLVATLHEAELREAALLAAMDDGVRQGGAWTAKDHVAHLSAWREHACTILSAAARGEHTPEVADIDGRNAAVYETWRLASRDSVEAAARASYNVLRDLVAVTPDPVLHRPRSSGGVPVWSAVLGNGCEHVAEHLSQWHLEHGDPAAAERVATWSCELIVESLPVTEARGNALYNLACFYGRSGRAGEALPLLQRALELQPQLRAFARSDPDFEPLRHRTDFTELLSAR